MCIWDLEFNDNRLLSTITNNFTRKEWGLSKEKKEELNVFKNELMNKLLDQERKQNQCLNLFNKIYRKSDNNSKFGGNSNIR